MCFRDSGRAVVVCAFWLNCLCGGPAPRGWHATGATPPPGDGPASFNVPRVYAASGRVAVCRAAMPSPFLLSFG